MITAKNLSIAYGKEKTVGVESATFSVKEGELFGLIGPDGAGKTSIFRMLTTLLLPDGGSGSVNGWDIEKNYREIRNSVGYMPGEFSLYPDLTIEENLSFFATVFNTTIEENRHLIEDIYKQIEPFKNRRAGKLSGGMKQKLALCCALIHKPVVLFLDEPTTGVDAVSRKEFWEMLKRLKEKGITILVSTPYMDEANLCDRIALIQNGKIMSIDTPGKTIENFPNLLFETKADDKQTILKALKEYENALDCYAFGEYVHVVIESEKNNGSVEKSREAIQSYLKDKNFEAIEVNPIEPTVEDCFIRLMTNTKIEK